MQTTITDEDRRCAPLALWRYGHEYLRAAHYLATGISVRCGESQVPYHMAAQGIEFALKALLRARGATMGELEHVVGHSLTAALERCEAHGMPPLRTSWREALVEVASGHRADCFAHLPLPRDAFPDIAPLVDAGLWILDWSAPEVVAHFGTHLAGDASPGAPQFLQRMRADLAATSSVVCPTFPPRA
jgi:hypothetical protein